MRIFITLLLLAFFISCEVGSNRNIADLTAPVIETSSSETESMLIELQSDNGLNNQVNSESVEKIFADFPCDYVDTVYAKDFRIEEDPGDYKPVNFTSLSIKYTYPETGEVKIYRYLFPPFTGCRVVIYEDGHIGYQYSNGE